MNATGGTLTWSIKDSLLRYVTVISRGSVEVGGGAGVDDEGVFSFPLRRAVRIEGEWALSFEGSVRLVAHHGLLDIRIVDPEFIVGDVGGVLIAQTADDGTTTPVAATPPAAPAEVGDALEWDAASELLPAAVEVFGSVYPAGTELAPLRISVPAARVE